MEKQRATQLHEKQARRQSIVAAAWALFQGHEYRAVTMAAVAATLGLAKGTLFVYFPTKEALFLAVLEEQLALWFARVNHALAATPTPLSVEGLVQILTQALIEQPHLARLLTLQSTILEANVDVATALAFKRGLLALVAPTSGRIEAALPFLAAGQGVQILMWVHALTVGLWQQADVAPAVQQAFAQDTTLRLFEIDFVPEFRAMLTALLRGLERETVRQ